MSFKKVLYVFLVLLIFSGIMPAEKLYSDNVYTNIKSGVYIPKELVTAGKLKFLIVPYSNVNYKFYQSIGKVTNIVLGNFNRSAKKITLISDKNSDGVVDIVAHWDPDLKKMELEKFPEKYCSSEKFAAYKKEIIDSKVNLINPEKASLQLLNHLIKDAANISRNKNGYRVVQKDLDAPGRERTVFYLADNGVNGVDLLFQHNYYYAGIKTVKPVIQYPVYCKDSFDPFAKELVKKIIKNISKYY